MLSERPCPLWLCCGSDENAANFSERRFAEVQLLRIPLPKLSKKSG
jgi:hypothetical protein